jgi:hypothetical protein
MRAKSFKGTDCTRRFNKVGNNGNTFPDFVQKLTKIING